MRQQDLETINASLPSLNLRCLLALFKLQLQLFTGRFIGKALRVNRATATRSARITPRLAVVLSGAVLLFVSFALRMELLSIASALAIWFAMQETEDERKARRAEEVADRHAEVYSEELARQMARKDAEKRHEEGDAKPHHGTERGPRRAQPKPDSVTYH